MTDTIVLLNNIHDVKKLEKYINDNNMKKICFDYDSYKALGTSCMIVEEYFNEKDKLFLDEFAIDLARNWYKNTEITKSLEINGINIGYLLELEFLPYFFQQLKRFIGVMRILQKEAPKRVITASLGNFILPTAKVEHINHGNDTDGRLYYDRIEIPISIKNTIYTFKISRKNYQNIKKIIDFATSLFIEKFAVNKKVDKKNILLLEFNPENYTALLESLSEQGYNVILLNQRRPAVTNLSSLKVIRKAGCKICFLEHFSSINNHVLSSLWPNSVFEKIFYADGSSFWSCIKDDFVKIVENRRLELLRKMTAAELLFNSTKIDLILDWAHTATEEKIISALAATRNIPVITLQHGAYPMNEKFVKYLPFHPIIPAKNKIVVWGDMMRSYVIQHGGTDDNVISIGSPKHDKFFQRKQKNVEAVLIVMSELYHSNFEGTHTKTFEDLNGYVKQLFSLIKKLSKKKIILKLRPVQTSYEIQSIIEKLGYKISIYRTQDIFDVMQICDTVISMNFSTVLLDAMILNKPTMTILPEKQGYEEDLIMKSGATLTVSNMNELGPKLKDILTDEDLRQKLVKNGQKIVSEYFVNHGTASEALAKFISSLL